MRILWITNIIIPAIAASINENISNREGWLSGIFDNWVNNDNYSLCVAFPISKDKADVAIKVNNIDCYSFHEDLRYPENYDNNIQKEIENIISKVKPDIVHIFGTEFPHALAAAKAIKDPSKVLLGIQGICTKIYEDYEANIPDKVVKEVTLRDFLKKDSVLNQKAKFLKRSLNENELIKISDNITGRTDFDKKYVCDVNDECIYYHMNETMRSSFYKDSWDLKNTIKHSIFIGQGDYPIKGMHFLLMAAGKLIDKYPDLTINIAGNSIINTKSIKDKLKTPSYGKYLRKLIKINNLSGHLNALGSLSEENMKQQYLNSAVFVLASYVENSPNTLAEAMLLGLPIVTSDAGGVKSMINDDEGFIYKRGDVDALASYIDQVFTLEDKEDEGLKIKCSLTQRKAKDMFDGETNYQKLISIYDDIHKRNLCR